MNKTDKIWYNTLSFLSALTTEQVKKIKKERPLNYKSKVSEDVENTLHSMGYIQFNPKISRVITQSGLQQLRDLEKIRNEDINRIVNIILAIIAIIAIGVSIYSTNTTKELSQRVIELTPSKYAHIDVTLTQYLNNTGVIDVSEFEQGTSHLGVNIVNTGQLNTGDISLWQSEYDSIKAESTSVPDIPSKSNYAFWLKFSSSNSTDIVGWHNITLIINCPNCLEQGILISQNISLCVDDKDIDDNTKAIKKDCNASLV